MSWNAQSPHASSIQSNDQEPTPFEVFSKNLKEYLWDDLDIDKLNNFRRRARELGPEAVTLLVSLLSKYLKKEEQLKKLNIEETYASFIRWAFHERHSGLIVFLTDPDTRQKLFLPNSPEQHIKLIERCLAENFIGLAAFFVNKFIESINPAKALEFFHEAFDIAKLLKDYRDFDTISYALLQNKKISLNTIAKLADQIPLNKFLIDLQCYKTILQCLDVAEFDPNLFWKERNLTLVELAAELGDESAIKSLLDKGANIKWDNDFVSRRPKGLQLATQHGHIKIVEMLLERGADINGIDDESKHSALYYAVDLGNDALIKLLKDKGATPIEFSDHYLTHNLNKYLKNKNKVAAKYFISHATSLEVLRYVSNQKKLLIHHFAEWGDIENLKLVFAKFIEFKNTPKSDFPKQEEFELTQSKLSDYLNKKTNNQNTALHIATIHGHIDIVSILLENGADPTIKNHEGHKPSELTKNSVIKLILEAKESEIASKILAQNGSKDIYVGSAVKVSKQAGEKLIKEKETAEEYKNNL